MSEPGLTPDALTELIDTLTKDIAYWDRLASDPYKTPERKISYRAHADGLRSALLLIRSLTDTEPPA